MTDETTTEQLAEIEGQAEDTPATGYTPPEGWRVLRSGEVLQPGDVWVNWEGTEARPDIQHGDGTTASGGRYIRRIEPETQTEPDKTQELPTKTQEPDDKTQELPAQYTPPEGWRVLAVGEALREGDVTVRKDGYCYPTERVGGWVGANQQYIRRIGPELQPQPVRVREGRWRTRGGQEFRVSLMPTDHWDFAPEYPWWDGNVTTWRTDGRFSVHENAMDLVEYLGPIEPDKTQELPDKTQELETKTQELPEYTPPEGWRVVRFGEQLLPEDVWVNQDGTEQRSNILHWDASAVSGGRCIRRIKPQPQPEPQAEHSGFEGKILCEQTQPEQVNDWPSVRQLRGELKTLQTQLGESRQRVTQLEELVGSLRNINEAQEKAFDAAGKENTALQHRLNAVATEWVEQAETIRRLQIELDAERQVPADSPELRQLRADLAEVTQDRDTYRHAHELLLNDANTAHERTKAMTVEAIAEWLEPVRLVDSANLANETLQHLPQIMRHLTGLESPEDVD